MFVRNKIHVTPISFRDLNLSMIFYFTFDGFKLKTLLAYNFDNRLNKPTTTYMKALNLEPFHLEILIKRLPLPHFSLFKEKISRSN